MRKCKVAKKLETVETRKHSINSGLPRQQKQQPTQFKKNIVDNEMSQTISLVDLPWHDVIVANVLPRISLNDCVNLQKLGYPFTSMVDSYFKSLKHFRSSVSCLGEDALAKVASKTQRLEKLSLERSSTTSTTLQSFLENNRFLTHINITELANIDDTALHPLIYCQNLRQLIAIDCDWLTTECVLTLLSHLKNLEYVNLFGCSELDIGQFEAVLRAKESERMKIFVASNRSQAFQFNRSDEGVIVTDSWRLFKRRIIPSGAHIADSFDLNGWYVSSRK